MSSLNLPAVSEEAWMHSLVWRFDISYHMIKMQPKWCINFLYFLCNCHVKSIQISEISVIVLFLSQIIIIVSALKKQQHIGRLLSHRPQMQTKEHALLWEMVVPCVHLMVCTHKWCRISVNTLKISTLRLKKNRRPNKLDISQQQFQFKRSASALHWQSLRG